MKSYIVFLKSGESLYGVMDDAEAEKLKQAYINKTPGVMEFTDTEGVILLESQNIVSLALNEPCKEITVGFKASS